MNLFGLSPGEFILIALVAMIVLGPEKLPETAASVGKWIREFRRVTQELTQQFADENPFTEIQRALSFNDEPTVISAVPEPAPLTTSNADFNVGHASADLQTVGMGGPSNGMVTRSTRRSDYFDHPSYYTAIDDSWTHSGLDGVQSLRPGSESLRLPIVDDWIHGVPVAPPPVEMPTAIVSDGESVADMGEVVSAEGVAAWDATSDLDLRPDPIQPSSTDAATDLVSEPVVIQADSLQDVLNTNQVAVEDGLDHQPIVESNGHAELPSVEEPHARSSSETEHNAPVTAGAGRGEEQRS